MTRDTTPSALEAQLAVLRRLGPAERFRLAAEMSEDARRISIEGEQRRHPELGYAEARTRVLRRLYGPELGTHVR